MKKLIFAAFFSCLLINQSSASCLEKYEDKITEAYLKGALSTVGAAATAYVGIFSTSIGISLVQSGEILQGVLTTIAADGPAVGISTTSVKQIVKIVSFSRVRNLIDQSEVMFGILLSETAEQLSEDLGKEVTEKDVADLVISANENKIFCDESRFDIYQFPEVINYLKEELK